MSKSLREKLMEHAYSATFRDGRAVKMAMGIASACRMDVNSLNGKVTFPVLASSAWVSGGLCGGNCWGSDADQSVSSEPEDDFSSMENLLEEIYPDLKLSQYRKLREFIVYGDYTVSEYYGNYTEYSFKFIRIDDLVSVLEES